MIIFEKLPGNLLKRLEFKNRLCHKRKFLKRKVHHAARMANRQEVYLLSRGQYENYRHHVDRSFGQRNII